MDFDVIIVGAGQAGIPLAMRLARVGKRVALAERSIRSIGWTTGADLPFHLTAAQSDAPTRRSGVESVQDQIDDHLSKPPLVPKHPFLRGVYAFESNASLIGIVFEAQEAADSTA